MHLTSTRFVVGAAVVLGAASGAALAAGDLSRQTPIELTVDLGSPGKHEFAQSNCVLRQASSTN